MRSAFLRTIEELAAADPRINLIVGDLGFTVVEPFAKRFPNQFLNAGVAEQNMTGLAVGMALSGKIVFTYSIANFPTLRCLEQIRNDGCYHKADIKIVSVGGGLAYGALGSSHQATEDLAILRSLPGMTVVAPGDPVEAEYATRAVAAFPGPCYLRLGKAGEPLVHKRPIDFQLGRALTVTEGRDITIISTCAMLEPCFRAAERLEAGGLSIRLVSMHTVKPLDADAVCRAADETGAIMTVEEHQVTGGLGGAVAECLSRNLPTPMEFVGVQNTFGESGIPAELIEHFGMGVSHIKKAVMRLLKKKS